MREIGAKREDASEKGAQTQQVNSIHPARDRVANNGEKDRNANMGRTGGIWSSTCLRALRRRKLVLGNTLS